MRPTASVGETPTPLTDRSDPEANEDDHTDDDVKLGPPKGRILGYTYV